MNSRSASTTDRIVSALDQALRTVFAPAKRPTRPSPAHEMPEPALSPGERDLAGRLMRVNHAGEIAAQALYHGQGVTARLDAVRSRMEQAAEEENDHLAWTRDRIEKLGTHTSLLGPFWYAGSFAIGAIAGLAGDRWSLGFVVETEQQVIRHLDSHLARLAAHDAPDRAVLERMKEDELQHATSALSAGAAALPRPVQSAMHLISRVMTRTAYWI